MVLAESFSMMTEPMRLTPADAGAARRMTMAGMWSPNGYDHEQSGATHVTSWSNTSIQMQVRAVVGSFTRFAQSEQTTPR